MPSVDFGHLYKFLASVGLVLIVAAFVVPWAFVQANDALLISNSALADLTPTAREVLAERQEAIARVQIWLPLGSLLIFTAGLACLLSGVWGWKKRQKASDEGEDLDLENKRQAIAVPMSKSEVDAKLLSEAEVDSPPLSPGTGATRSTHPSQLASEQRRLRMDDLRACEERLAQLATNAYKDFQVASNVRISGPGDASQNSRTVDVLMSPETGEPWGQLGLDLKRVSRLPTVAPAMINLAIAALHLQRGSVFAGTRGRPRHTDCAAVLVFVFDDEDQMGSAKERLQSDVELVNVALKNPVGVLALPKSTFNRLETSDLRRLLATAWLGEFVLG